MHLACTGNISLGPPRNISTFTYSEPARRDDFGKVRHLNGIFFSVTRRSRSDGSESLPTYLSVSTDLTDVTLVSDDTY